MIKRMTDRQPRETGRYIANPDLEVNVYVEYAGHEHGGTDNYDVLIHTTDGRFVLRDIFSGGSVPSFIVGGKNYHIQCYD